MSWKYARSGVMAAACLVSSLAVASPSFDEYQVPYQPVQTPAQVKITDGKSRQFKDELEYYADQPVNFAGHYVLASWGCGASCVIAAAIDARTGDVTWLPFTVCCWASDVTEPLTFRRDSRLLVVRGMKNETDPGTYFYRVEERKFVQVGDEREPKQ